MNFNSLLNIGALGVFFVAGYQVCKRLSSFSTLSSRQTLLPKMREIETLIFTIFADQERRIGNKRLQVFAQCKKYALQTEINNGPYLNPLNFSGGGLNLTAQKIKIYIETNGILIPIVTPSKVQKNILKFILKGRPVKAYCCVDFVQQLWDVYEPDQPNIFVPSKWTIFPLRSEGELEVGTSIFLNASFAEKTLNPVHFALYLGHGLYLSLCGSAAEGEAIPGILIVATLPEMQALYPSNGVYKMYLK